MKKFCIKIYSEGGQGIKSMIDKLGEDIEKHESLKRYFNTAVVKYDSIIKGGTVEANFIIAQNSKNSPFFDHANLCIILKQGIENPISCDKKIKKEDFTRQEVGELKEQIIGEVLSHFSTTTSDS